MPEQMCVCSHPYSIHRLNRQIGNRNECWAQDDDLRKATLCQCKQYQAAVAATHEGGHQE